MTREERAFKRLHKRAKSDHVQVGAKDEPGHEKADKAVWPRRTCEVNGGWLKCPTPVLFEKKYGVWFFVSWGAALNGLADWGFTQVAFMRFCRKNHMTYRWLSNFDTDTDLPESASQSRSPETSPRSFTHGPESPASCTVGLITPGPNPVRPLNQAPSTNPVLRSSSPRAHASKSLQLR